jgi:Flp pilus assembly protein CpaB
MQSQPPPAPATTPNWSAGFRRRIPFYILIAIFFSLLAGVLVFSYLQNLRAQMLPSIPVVVASRELIPGTHLTDEQIGLLDVPEGIVPENALHDVNQALGREVAIPLAARQVILSTDLVGASGTGLSAKLPDGRWALVLPISWLASPAPASSPGDHFDLLAYQQGRPSDEAGVIVSDVAMLEGDGELAQFNQLTLIVTLDQAKAILYARANGFSLLLLLRPKGG